jgi:small subunit ribosomal protein S6
MRQYEVTFIVDPVLSSDEANATVKVDTDLITDKGATIVNIDELGLKQLAYPINKRNTGVYYCVEFQPVDGTIVDEIELSFRRDERIMRFLVVTLDKYGIKYNEDKRNGLIGKIKKKEPKPVEDRRGGRRDNRNKNSAPRKPKPAATPEVSTEAKDKA